MYFLRERFFEGALSNNFEIYFFKEQFWKYSWNVFFENVFFLTTKNIEKKKWKKNLQKKLKKELKENEKIEKKIFFLKKKFEKEKQNQRIKNLKNREKKIKENLLRRNWMLQQSYWLLKNPVFYFSLLSWTQSVNTCFVPYHSQCSACVTYRTPYCAFGHQVCSTQPLPRHAEDFFRGGKYTKNVPLPT